MTRARAGRSSGGAGSSNEPDNEPEHNEREILNNVQPSKPSEKKNNRPPAVADQPKGNKGAKKNPAPNPKATSSNSKERAEAAEFFLFVPLLPLG